MCVCWWAGKCVCVGGWVSVCWWVGERVLVGEYVCVGG